MFGRKARIRSLEAEVAILTATISNMEDSSRNVMLEVPLLRKQVQAYQEAFTRIKLRKEKKCWSRPVLVEGPKHEITPEMVVDEWRRERRRWLNFPIPRSDLRYITCDGQSMGTRNDNECRDLIAYHCADAVLRYIQRFS